MEFSFTESAVGLVGVKICWFTACDRFWDLTDLPVAWLVLISYRYIGRGTGVRSYRYTSRVTDVGSYLWIGLVSFLRSYRLTGLGTWLRSIRLIDCLLLCDNEWIFTLWYCWLFIILHPLGGDGYCTYGFNLC